MNLIKNTLIFGLGALTGSLFVYKIVEDKYSKIAEEEIANMKEYYESTIDIIEEDSIEAQRNIVKDFTEKQKINYSNIANNYYRPSPEEIVREKRYNSDEEDEDEDEKSYGPTEDEQDEEIPYIITLNEFSDEKLHFDKITLTYYEDDDTLADEQEEVIPDPVSVVGEEALFAFGDGVDPDIVYVRNHKLGSDYEVVRVRESYAESVLGILPEERVRVRRIKDE